jgi:hypothetical protein
LKIKINFTKELKKKREWKLNIKKLKKLLNDKIKNNWKLKKNTRKNDKKKNQDQFFLKKIKLKDGIEKN